MKADNFLKMAGSALKSHRPAVSHPGCANRMHSLGVKKKSGLISQRKSQAGDGGRIGHSIIPDRTEEKGDSCRLD